MISFDRLKIMTLMFGYVLAYSGLIRMGKNPVVQTNVPCCTPAGFMIGTTISASQIPIHPDACAGTKKKGKAPGTADPSQL
jgi:hypothetical protein